jgi:hypothetical protein
VTGAGTGTWTEVVIVPGSKNGMIGIEYIQIARTTWVWPHVLLEGHHVNLPVDSTAEMTGAE